MFYGVSEYKILLVQETDVLFTANMFYNQKRSIISAQVLTI